MVENKELTQLLRRIERLERGHSFLKQFGKKRIRWWALSFLLVIVGVGSALSQSNDAGLFVFNPGTPAKASEVNYNFKYLEERLVPPGTVIFFNGDTCPPGWSPVESAAGRVIVGVDATETVGGTMGNPYGDLEERTVSTSSSGDHGHKFMRFEDTAETNSWYSFDSSGAEFEIILWQNGIDDANSGYYPLAVAEDPGPNDSVTLYTAEPPPAEPPPGLIFWCIFNPLA